MIQGFRDEREVEALAAWVLDETKRRGASAADFVCHEGKNSRLLLRDGKTEESVSGTYSLYGVRTIMSDGRQGIATGCSFDRSSLSEVIDWSIENCCKSEPDDGVLLYEGGRPENDGLTSFDGEILNITPKDRMESCLEMTSRAKTANERITSVERAARSDGYAETYMFTTAGIKVCVPTTSASCAVSVVATDGKTNETGYCWMGHRKLDGLKPEKVAETAAFRGASALGGEPIRTGTYTVMAANRAAASLVDEIGALFCASDIYKNCSMMKGKLGETVASPCVTIVDDGTVPWKLGTYEYDSEAVPTCRTVLIEKGVAKSYLYNLQYAYRFGTETTGNCVRSVSSLPDVGTTNLILEPGEESEKSLLSKIGRGMYITDFMGLHTIDPVSGDFSVGAKGFLIERGELVRPVSGVAIASNLIDFIKKISAVASNLCFFGDVASPSLVVEDVVIAGK